VRNSSYPYQADLIFLQIATAKYVEEYSMTKEMIGEKTALVEVRYVGGKIILPGFRVRHRGQAHGKFHLLFNIIPGKTTVDTGTIQPEPSAPLYSLSGIFRVPDSHQPFIIRHVFSPDIERPAVVP